RRAAGLASAIPSVLAACALAAAPAAHAAPDAAIFAAATAQQPALIDTLKTLVLIESGSLDVEGLHQMASVLDTRLKALGFKTERRRAVSGAGADILIGTMTGTGT